MRNVGLAAAFAVFGFFVFASFVASAIASSIAPSIATAAPMTPASAPAILPAHAGPIGGGSPPLCQPEGFNCRFDMDCCQGVCKDRIVCQAPLLCYGPTLLCDRDDQCCSHQCSRGVCQ